MIRLANSEDNRVLRDWWSNLYSNSFFSVDLDLDYSRSLRALVAVELILLSENLHLPLPLTRTIKCLR